GLARRPVNQIESLMGAGANALIRRLLVGPAPQGLTPQVADAVVASFEYCYGAIAGTQCAPYPGCFKALSRLQAAGVHMACVTNKELRHARAVLRRVGLHDFFATVVGGDSYANKKPHGSVLRNVAAGMGVALSRVTHVGDSSIDVEAARNAGVTAWAVPYGYNAGVPVALSKPDRMFDDLAAVADAVLEAGVS
ncbi:MAG: HAD-IA family hydrolase, partial [Rhodoferax sp.]|nr:HAD-IA family hydrolase [Rhodoferax sp.]